MSTFSKLSPLAQYDDMCGYTNQIIQDFVEADKANIAANEKILSIFKQQKLDHEKEMQQILVRVNQVEREKKKADRQLTEARSAVSRESKANRELKIEIKELRTQLDTISRLANRGAHAEVVKCLETRRLSPIQAEDSDDCASGIEYDRTEEDIIDTDYRSPRKSQAYADALENLQSNEQPTLLLNRYMSLDKNQDENPQHILETLRDEPRRSLRLQAHRRSRQDSSEQSNPTTSASSSNNLNKFPDSNPETDTNSLETDDQDIEYVRQQLQKYEADKREKLASSNSTPNIKEMKKGATMSARSAANLMKSVSNVGTPVANALKPHSFVTKKILMPNDSCVSCGFKVKFYTLSYKCQVCNITCHPDCKDNAPLPCVKITAPTNRSKQRKILISDYVSSDAVPKVPALIVHCCNEIEKEENITTAALYQSLRYQRNRGSSTKDTKSKSGMPNLSKVDVHLLTGVVKRFLQCLDESLITTTLWNYFAEAIKLSSDIDSQTHMSYYIENDLPTANRDTLSFLMQHLHIVLKHADKNLMDTKKLAKAFASTIVGHSSCSLESSKKQREVPTQMKIMETLFSIDEKFWAGFVQRMPTSARSASSYGSRLLSGTPSGKESRTRDSRIGSTLPTPKLKPLFK